MAGVNTLNKRRAVAGLLPIPDGAISIADRRQVAGLYPYATLGAVVTMTALRYMTLDLGGGLGMTIGPGGNTLPLTILTYPPTLPPQGGKGVCFAIVGGSAKIYIWDGASWKAN